MPLIGTAGHVDHGKSTLVQRLTGRDPDRWDEEKRRGLTIDLGFAWTDLGDGTEASFVDVPGHERYLKNMLAGVEAIDVALFVVAANEGWKPQSEEHLAALDLLGATAGVVALTKSDLVDADEIELRILELGDKLSGTTLEGSLVVPVSAVTGAGLPALTEALLELVTAVEPRSGRSRMWVDRVFTVPGSGTVVTGSLLAGSFAVGDEIEIYPQGASARIRSIQTHEKPAETIHAGRRVALGLAGVDTDQVHRGDMVGFPQDWRVSRRFSCRIRVARYVDDLPERGAYQAHIGSGAQNARIERSEGGVAVVRLDRPLPLAMGDRFILRDSGRRIVAAGGQVLDPHPRNTGQAISEALKIDPETTHDNRATQLLELREFDRIGDLEKDTDGGAPAGGVMVGEFALSERFRDRLIDKADSLVAAEHKSRPLNAGLPLATLAEQLGVDRAIAEAVVGGSEELALNGPNVAMVGHRAVLTPQLEARWHDARRQVGEALSVPLVRDLGLPDDAIHLLVRAGELTRVGNDFAYLPEQVDQIVAAVSQLDVPFSVGDVKDALGLSRKYVMPILEWLDSNQYTVRRGDSRVLGVRLSGDRH